MRVYKADSRRLAVPGSKMPHAGAWAAASAAGQRSTFRSSAMHYSTSTSKNRDGDIVKALLQYSVDVGVAVGEHIVRDQGAPLCEVRGGSLMVKDLNEVKVREGEGDSARLPKEDGLRRRARGEGGQARARSWASLTRCCSAL